MPPLDKLEASKSCNTGLLEYSPPGAGTKADVEMEQGEKSETSVPDTSNTFKPGTGRAWDWTGMEERWNGLVSGFGQERASATTFSLPGIWTTELVNSARYARCLCWQADLWGLVLNKAWVNGLWSLNIVNSLPSSMNLSDEQMKMLPGVLCQRWSTFSQWQRAS